MRAGICCVCGAKAPYTDILTVQRYCAADYEQLYRDKGLSVVADQFAVSCAEQAPAPSLREPGKVQ